MYTRWYLHDLYLYEAAVVAADHGVGLHGFFLLICKTGYCTVGIRSCCSPWIKDPVPPGLFSYTAPPKPPASLMENGAVTRDIPRPCLASMFHVSGPPSWPIATPFARPTGAWDALAPTQCRQNLLKSVLAVFNLMLAVCFVEEAIINLSV